MRTLNETKLGELIQSTKIDKQLDRVALKFESSMHYLPYCMFIGDDRMSFDGIMWQQGFILFAIKSQLSTELWVR